MKALIFLFGLWTGFYIGGLLGIDAGENSKWATLAVYEGYIADRDTLIGSLIVQVDSANAVARRSIAGMKECNDVAARAINLSKRAWDVQYNQVLPGLVLWPDSARDSTWGAETIPCPDGIPGCLVLHWKPARVSAVETKPLPRVSTLRVR